MAYAGLLGERRRDLHAAVAAAIERLHADRLVEHVERLAHHARQGEVWDKAARYLRQAGAKVYLRAANREAAVPTAPAWLQRAGLGADVMETGPTQRGSEGGGRLMLTTL